MAKTIIDSLLVTLGLSNTDYKKGMDEANKIRDDFDAKNAKSGRKNDADEKKRRDAEKKAHQEEMRRRKESMEAVKKFKNELLSFATLFTAGMGILAFAEHTITATASLGRLSDNTKMSVEDLAGLQYAMKGVGGTAEGASAAVDKAAMAVASFKTGMSNQAVSGLFTAAGGTNVDLKGAFKDTKSFLLAQADVVNALYKQDPTTALLKARQMMGIDPETFNLLKLGREEVEKRIAMGAKITGINRAQADAAQMAQMEWNNLSARFAAIGREVLFPVLKAISDWMSKHRKDINAWIHGLSKAISEVSPEALEKVGKAVDYIVEGVKFAVKLLATLGTAMGEAAGWVATAFGLTGDDKQFNKNIANENAQVKAYWASRQAARTQGGEQNTVHIENLNLHTQATDGPGVAKDFSKNVKRYMPSRTMQANSAG